jgi:hypothetical protein
MPPALETVTRLPRRKRSSTDPSPDGSVAVVAVKGPVHCGKVKRVKHKLVTTLLVVAALVVSTFALSGAKPAAAAPNDNYPGQRWLINGGCPEKPGTSPPCRDDNAILIWDEMLLRAIRLHPPQTGPTVTSRALAVLHTATYDAWAAYDSVAVPTLVNGNVRQPASERTGQAGLDNKREAISYAAYTVLRDLFPVARYPNIAQAKWDEQMVAMSYPTDPSTPSAAATVGIQAANAVTASRADDGSNQVGGYADTTNYHSVNTWDTVNVPWRWQPLCVPNSNPPPDAEPCGPGKFVQKAYTPQWKNVTPFALNAPNQFKPPGPPKLANGSYDPKDIDTALADTSNLTDTKKMMAEYWADGPKSEFPPGHWAVIAQALSRKRPNSIDTDAKMFFVLGNAVLDAGISAWSAKYQLDDPATTVKEPTWDFWRPITAIRERYKTKMINSWKGPYKGYGLVPAEQWIPYQAPNVVTPPFPEYSSGHSTFSGAARIAIVAFLGTDSFNAQVVIPAGTSAFEPRNDSLGLAGTPAKDVVLSWKNLLDASDQAGWSRRYGGIHFYSGDMHGRANGASVGYWAYDKAKTYFNGTATPATP